MKVYKLYREQIVKGNIKDIWKFFSDPRNLSKITPPYMNFKILTEDLPDEIFPGLIIEYKVSPVGRIPVYWVTEITAIEKYKYFIDEQRFGPYKFWHHLHLFQQVDEGKIKIIDKVHYIIPLGIVGQIMNSLFVKKRLDEIFDYRAKVISEIFGEK
jgi:ligand-binding SRPBCC domain-containing protein